MTNSYFEMIITCSTSSLMDIHKFYDLGISLIQDKGLQRKVTQIQCNINWIYTTLCGRSPNIIIIIATECH